MQRFAQLIEELNNTRKTNDKRDALLRYLNDVPDEDKVWLVAIFTGRRPKRIVNSSLLASWALERAGLPEWLFGESYHTVGDLAETITLIMPAPQKEEGISLSEMMLLIQKYQSSSEEDKYNFINYYWAHLSRSACFVFNKIIIGGFRIGVSQNIVIQALAQFT